MTSTAEPARTTSADNELSLLRNGSLLVLGLGHATVDLCANSLSVFYPMLMASLHLSYASAGALMTAQSTASSLSQPLFGWLADRFGSRWIAALCGVGTAAAVALLGYVLDYPSLLVVVSLLGIGAGAYHPQGAKTAALLGGRWRTTALSIYMTLGSVGFAAGPLLAATVLAPAGLRSTTLLLIPGILMAALLFAFLGRADRLVMDGQERGHGGPVERMAWAGVATLAAVIIARSWVNYGLVTFLPLLYAARAQEPHLAGQMLFLLFFLEGAGTALGGWLADRFGRRLTLVVSFALLSPLVHLFLGAGGSAAIALAVPMGMLLGCSVTVTLAAAQEILPSRMGMASGIAISLSQIMGGAGVGLQGLLADRYGLDPSMETLAVAAATAAVASLGIGERRRG